MDSKNNQTEKPFQFKQFTIHQEHCSMKVGTDGVLLGAWAGVEGAKKILDIGAGTGIIAIMAAQRAPDAIVDAVEIDKAAFNQGMENMAASPWSNRLRVFHLPVKEYARSSTEKYDLILSNPPFFTGGTFSPEGGRNNVRHTVKLSHGDLLDSVRKLLAPQGRLALILPYLEGLRFRELAASYHFYCVRVTEVRSKADKPIERLLMEFSPHIPAQMTQSELIIQHEGNNNWTDAYIALTGDFYLYM